jgi:hypothetical protein
MFFSASSSLSFKGMKFWTRRFKQFFHRVQVTQNFHAEKFPRFQRSTVEIISFYSKNNSIILQFCISLET